jgi:hypothetical protein
MFYRVLRSQDFLATANDAGATTASVPFSRRSWILTRFSNAIFRGTS